MRRITYLSLARGGAGAKTDTAVPNHTLSLNEDFEPVAYASIKT